MTLINTSNYLNCKFSTSRNPGPSLDGHKQQLQHPHINLSIRRTLAASAQHPILKLQSSLAGLEHRLHFQHEITSLPQQSLLFVEIYSENKILLLLLLLLSGGSWLPIQILICQYTLPNISSISPSSFYLSR